jgi:branched-chain amino acid transport system ATP-binding protein
VLKPPIRMPVTTSQSPTTDAPVEADTTETEPTAQDEPFTPGYVRSRTADASSDDHTDYAPLLRLSGVKSGYGRLPVLHGVEFAVAAGETAVMLGLNGAGKTTTALNICGAVGTWDGEITYDGQDITAWGTRQCVSNGIVLVPEGRRVFPDLSVERNLEVGAWTQRRDSDWLHAQQERVFGYFPRLRERRAQLAGTLSGGEQQMLAIGRGLMANPRLLIVDEASMGLAPVIVKDVFEIVSHINEDGVTVLMIEQNVGALDVADLGLVMEQGRVVRELRGAELSDRGLVSEVLMG